MQRIALVLSSASMVCVSLGPARRGLHARSCTAALQKPKIGADLVDRSHDISDLSTPLHLLREMGRHQPSKTSDD